MESKHLCLFCCIWTFAFYSCHKDPIAIIESEKDQYTTGDTIRLSSKSYFSKKLLWTFPDGQKVEADRIDYPTAVYDLGAPKQFTLEVYSRDGKRTAIASRKVKMNQAILESDFWMLGSTKIVPATKSGGLDPTILHWVVVAATQELPKSRRRDLIEFILPGSQRPTTDTVFTLSTSETPESGNACIKFIWRGEEFEDYTTYPISGTLLVTISQLGNVTYAFTCKTKFADCTGNLTCN